MEEEIKVYFRTEKNFEKLNTPPSFSSPDNNEYDIILSGGKDNYN